ncbi:MAG: glutamate--cysteine ligase [Mariprofundaceae bacterium]|nr:glutamate--cysteine ligase [Mariprofundaceae bacterium]
MIDKPLTTKAMIEFFRCGCKPRMSWGIGTEHEKIPFHTSTLAPVPYAGKEGIGALLEALVDSDWQAVREDGNIIALQGNNGASITLEPGGQLELSGAVLFNLHHTHAETKHHLQHVMAVADRLHIGFLTTAFQPQCLRQDVPWMPKSRYAIMRDYMPKVGSQGLDMMLRTSTVQANLDFSSEQDMAKKMRIACCLQPIVTALFAASPFKDGKASGLLSTRAACWLDTDAQRTGIPICVFDDAFGFSDWVEYVLDVPMYFVMRDGQFIDCSGASFRDFQAGNLTVLKGQLPTLDDWALHTSTVFPDVRLKQFIEMRGADAGSLEMTTALPALWKGLLYDGVSEDAVWQVIKDWSHSTVNQLREDVISEALKAKIKGVLVQEIALHLLHLAQQGLQRSANYNAENEDESIYLQPLWTVARSGETLAENWLKKYHGAWKRNIKPIFGIAKH